MLATERESITVCHITMSTCLSFKDLIDINKPQVTEMQRVADSFPDPNAPGACDAFSKQVRLVEGILTQTYGVATVISRKTEDLREIAEIWNLMSVFCNSVLRVAFVTLCDGAGPPAVVFAANSIANDYQDQAVLL